MNTREKVTAFKTKHNNGFIQTEIDMLLKDYPDIDMDKFHMALLGVTCLEIDNETIFYHCDIIYAIRCGIENKSLSNK